VPLVVWRGNETILAQASAEAHMHVRALMTAPVETLTIDDTLNHAAKTMRDHAVGCVPIVDRHGVLVGMLTDRDIALAAYERGESLWRLPIETSMHQPVHTCRADDTLATAAATMRTHRLRRLPVVDAAGKPMGLISLDDLTHALHRGDLDRPPGLSDADISGLYEATSGRSKHRRAGGR
jgi:CBS domain-containing protein